MTDETILLEEQGIKITNLRAMFGGKTYAVSNITSVERETTPASSAPLVFAAIGVLMAVMAVPSFFQDRGAFSSGPNISLLVIGFLVLGLGILMTRAAKPSYNVKISTASGEIKAFTSDSDELTARITSALNDAIIHKG